MVTIDVKASETTNSTAMNTREFKSQVYNANKGHSTSSNLNEIAALCCVSERTRIKSIYNTNLINQIRSSLRDSTIEITRHLNEHKLPYRGVYAFWERGIRGYSEKDDYVSPIQKINYIFRQTIDIEFDDNVHFDLGSRSLKLMNMLNLKRRLKIYGNYLSKPKVKMDDGLYTVIFDQEAVGLLVHEAIGHLFEYDTIMQEPTLNDFFPLGKHAGISELNIVDNPLLINGYGSYRYDDEGNKAYVSHLIKDGVINQYMHSEKTAAYAMNELHCNARYVNIGEPCLVRMSNTYMKRGKSSFQEIISSTERGIYVRGTKNCCANRIILFQPREAYYVAHGEICEMIVPPNVYIDATTFLSNIIQISNDLKIYGGGLGGCSKRGMWPLPVGSGGPHIKVRGVYCCFL